MDGRRHRNGAHALAALIAAISVLATPRASAQSSALLALEAGAAMPISSPQMERFGPGGVIGAGLLLPLDPALVAVIRARGALLSDGAPPSDSTLRDPGVGGLASVSAGLRLRPVGFAERDRLERADHAWLEVGAGAALTGSLVRPVLTGALGWAFAIDDVRLSPNARVEHVIHWDDPLDSGHALVASVGLELVLFDARTPLTPYEPAPEAPSDRDGDGFLDPVDGCPDEPEDVDAFEDDDGCPDRDDDRDGLLDGDDGCRLEPEDHDGWQDEDGCPDPDDDGDGFLDGVDACPRDAEIVNGVDDQDGCPDAGLVELHEGRIVIDEHVLFDFDRARVRRRARPILAAVVELWRQHPEWARVRVEGHTDLIGDDAYNQTLSERRAHAVRAVLREMGIDEGRIDVEGHGERQPLAVGEGETVHQVNRRVELVVITGAGEEVSP